MDNRISILPRSPLAALATCSSLDDIDVEKHETPNGDIRMDSFTLTRDVSPRMLGNPASKLLETLHCCSRYVPLEMRGILILDQARDPLL